MCWTLCDKYVECEKERELLWFMLQQSKPTKYLSHPLHSADSHCWQPVSIGWLIPTFWNSSFPPWLCRPTFAWKIYSNILRFGVMAKANIGCNVFCCIFASRLGGYWVRGSSWEVSHPICLLLLPFVGMRIRHEARVRLQNRRLLCKTGTFARLWRDPNLGAQPPT